MFCDEPFVLDHQLKHKKSQLLLLELDDEEETPQEQSTETTFEPATETLPDHNTPQLSLQASLAFPIFTQ